MVDPWLPSVVAETPTSAFDPVMLPSYDAVEAAHPPDAIPRKCGWTCDQDVAYLIAASAVVAFNFQTAAADNLWR